MATLDGVPRFEPGVRRGQAKGIFYPGATHDFDDPGTDRRDVPANVATTGDAMPRAVAFLSTILNAPAVPR